MGNTHHRRQRPDQGSRLSEKTNLVHATNEHEVLFTPTSEPMCEADDYELYINKDAGLMHPANYKRQRGRIVQFALGSQWGRRLEMPDVLQALVCDYLTRDDLRSLKHVSRGAHFFVERRHQRLSRFRNPQHLGRITTFADLNAYQRLDLKLMRFYDRPIWQRILIGGACVPLVPFVLLWHSPKAVGFAYHKAIKPASVWIGHRVLVPTWHGITYTATHCIVRPVCAIGRAIAWTGHTIYHRALVPAATGTAKSISWTACTLYHRALVPTAKGISWTACTLYRTVFTPIGHGTVWTADQVYRGLCVPIGHGSVRAAQATKQGVDKTSHWLITHIKPAGGSVRRMARAMYTNVFVPVGRGMAWIAHQCYDQLLAPIGEAVYKTVCWIGDKLIRLVAWFVRTLFRWVIRPLWHALVFVWKRVIMATCRFFWVHVVVPVCCFAWTRVLEPFLRTSWHIVRFVAESIIWKVLASLIDAARFLLVDVLWVGCVQVLSTAYDWVLAPLGTLLAIIAQGIWAGCTLVTNALAGLLMALAQIVWDGSALVASTVAALASAIATALWATTMLIARIFGGA
jgi:hypothetical protein